MLGKTLSIFPVLATFVLSTHSAFGKFIPDDQIKNPYQRFSAEDANMTEKEFNEIIDKAFNYTPPKLKPPFLKVNPAR